MECSYDMAKAGDRTATTEIVDSLRPRITRMAAYYGRRTGEDPDDLLQEAWYGLLEAVRQIDTTIGTPEQYLIQRARWRMLDAVRRARVRRCLPMDEVVEERLVAADDTEEALGSAHVSAFLGELKDNQRDVVRLLLEGLTWREAGDHLGCSSANIAYHVRQIRRRYEEWAGEPVAEGAL